MKQLHIVKPEPERSEWTPATNRHWRNPNWIYVRSESTDIRKTFERARKEMEKKA